MTDDAGCIWEVEREDVKGRGGVHEGTGEDSSRKGGVRAADEMVG